MLKIFGGGGEGLCLFKGLLRLFQTLEYSILEIAKFLVNSSVSQVIEFLLWGSKLVQFLAKFEHTSRNLQYFVNRNNARSSKTAKIVLCQKVTDFSSFKNINLGDHFLLEMFFSNSNFQTFYFLRLCPIHKIP